MTQKKSPVICDGCGKNISATGNAVDYRLELSIKQLPPWYVLEGETGGVVTAMMIYPEIKETKHFCNNLGCVKRWLER